MPDSLTNRVEQERGRLQGMIAACNAKVTLINRDSVAFADAKIASIEARLPSKFLGESMRKHLEALRDRVAADKAAYAISERDAISIRRADAQAKLDALSVSEGVTPEGRIP